MSWLDATWIALAAASATVALLHLGIWANDRAGIATRTNGALPPA